LKLRISKLKLLILVVMSIVGFVSSAFVLIVWYSLKQALPVCTGGSIFGIPLDCNSVLGSKYSSVFGVPLEVLALVYFMVNLAFVYLIAFGSDRAARVSLRTLFWWRFIGLVLVPYLVFIEVVLIRAICLYCTIMHVAIIADFLIITYLLYIKHVDLGLGSGPATAGGSTPAVQ
jgi:uncharacterized membrane protein